MSGLLGAISPVAVSALIPRLVPAAELPSANGLNGVIESTAMATGAVAGGALLALVGIGPALALDLITFFLAAILFAGISTAAAIGRTGRGRRRRRRCRRRVCATFSPTARSSPRSARFASPSWQAASSTRRSRASSTEVGLGAGAYGYGFGAIALGLAVGGAVAGSIRVEHADTGVLGRTLLATAVVFCALAAVTSAPLALLLLCWSACSTRSAG